VHVTQVLFSILKHIYKILQHHYSVYTIMSSVLAELCALRSWALRALVIRRKELLQIKILNTKQYYIAREVFLAHWTSDVFLS